MGRKSPPPVKAPESTFPTAIFVTWEPDGDGGYFLLHTDLKSVDAPAVAIYNLTEEGVVHHPPAEFVSKG